jgi:primosomal protein N' (replication factor Y)
LFVEVKLLKGYQKTLTYKIPDSWDKSKIDGTVIHVPLKNTVVPALVTKVLLHPPANITFEIKEATGQDLLPSDKNYTSFIKKVARFYCIPEKLLYKRMRGFVLTREKRSCRSAPVREEKKINVTLTNEQQVVVDYLVPHIKQSHYAPTLLHGVTGSGKTEIYKKLIIECFENKKTTILLLPEVSLSLQFEHLLKKTLPSKIPIFGFHSASGAATKKSIWKILLEKKPALIIGVHLPILLPIPNLGCIIVDEEHESGFSEKKHPKINSKEVAIWRAKLYNIPILLGSATPSINSLYNVKRHNWRIFKLEKRFSGSFPNIKTIKIKKERRKSFWITRELEHAIADRLTKKEQTLIFINRRGYSFFVQCKKCSHTFLCPNCSVSLTLHKQNDEHKLCCHYCDYKQKNPTACSQCGDKELQKRGIGTQQVVTILQELFPNAVIARADLDTTKKKKAWHQTVEKFENGEIDILVGTQTITKGYHFPRVTLVGILWADLNAHFPVFNASETALQQLIQVAGRAGRQSEESLVIAQIMNDHTIFEFLKEEDYTQFCEQELKFRKETNYPPFWRFLQIELKHTDKKIIDFESQKLFDILYKHNKENVLILGPAQPLVYRIQKIEIRHIFLKSKDFEPIYALLQKIENHSWKCQIFIVPTQ